MVKETNRAESSLDPRALAARLNTAVVHMHRQFRRLDDELDLPAAQASALAVLVNAGAHTIGALAHIELVAPPTMTRIVAALESRGYATRKRSEGDMRVVVVEATETGRDVISRALSHRLERMAADLALLTPEQRRDVDQALELLTRIRRPAGASPATVTTKPSNLQ
jgi:DNA-binding MarR family transcriptional regulator